MAQNIIVKNAYANNLKNIDIEIPKNSMVVITGLSGSGKTSLAFDILDNESRRQYMESLGMITDGVSKADCDFVKYLPPSISVVQHLNNKNPRSTVGTMTELYSYIRILFAKLGKLNGENKGWSMSEFSFNKPAGACPRCTGLGRVREVELEQLFDSSKSIPNDAIYGWDIHYILRNTEALNAAARYYGYDFDINDKIDDYCEDAKTILLYGTISEETDKMFPNTKPPKTTKDGRFEGLVTNIRRRYSEKANNKTGREKLEKYFVEMVCPDCNGDRIKKEVRDVKLANETIVSVSNMSINQLKEWLLHITSELTEEENQVSKPLISDMLSRIAKFQKVKVGYLSLIRSLPTLSNGEAQRLKIANLLSSGLSGVLYILDEPTKGLHGLDVNNLLDILEELKDQGNHLLLIEHNKDAIERSDYIIDMGPGSGIHGGEVVANGTIEEVMTVSESKTAQYLKDKISFTESNMNPINATIRIENISLHNVENQTIEIPLHQLVSVAGVSGSGKSTIFMDVLAKELLSWQKTGSLILKNCSNILGTEHLKGVKVVTQGSIGRSSRSNPATYVKLFEDIRKVFTKTEEAKKRGLSASHFSFNGVKGQCPKCKGTGQIITKMHFLPDVKVVCDECNGKRFKDEILEVTIHGYNISDILDLTIEEAITAFEGYKTITKKLKMLEEVGVSYLKLGQEFSTLSGGEMQRIKLAKDLIDDESKNLLYIFDEPSSGLHFSDTDRLIKLFKKIVEKGNSVIVIEHNPQFLVASDYLIEVGPGSGMFGGEIVYQGKSNNIINKNTPTGTYLKGIV